MFETYKKNSQVNGIFKTLNFDSKELQLVCSNFIRMEHISNLLPQRNVSYFGHNISSNTSMLCIEWR